MLHRFIILLTFDILTIQFANAQNITITELKPHSDSVSLDHEILPWIELKNNTGDSLLLSNYIISADSVNFLQLPDLKLPPFNYYVLWFGNESREDSSGYILNCELNPNAESIYLIGDGSIIHVKIPDGITSQESYGPYPESSDTWIFFPKNFTTRGTANTYPGAWQKLAQTTSFSPRDSSPNGSLVYDGKVWIFEGYKFLGNDFYESSADVQSSEDGIHWTLVNENPPYNPYSAFVVFDGWIWAFEEKAFRSKDGIVWEDMGEIPLATGGRVTEFNGKLYWTSGGEEVWASNDGLTWDELTWTTPWQMRAWPGFQAFNGKLWLFGGTGYYWTPNPVYYNDIWSSIDGITWEQEVEQAIWPGRFWFGSEVFDNKLWILGGYNLFNDKGTIETHFGNQNDVWYSEDGINWTELKLNNWPERHSMFTWVKGNNLYISSGANGEFLYNDVWRFEKEHTNADSLEAHFDFDRNQVYGAPPIPIPLSIQTGQSINFASGDSTIVSISGHHIEIKKVGITTIYVTVASDVLHYGLEWTIPLRINKKDLVVKAMDTVKRFGFPLPEFELFFDGFVNGDNPSSLDEVPSISTEANYLSPIGVYPARPYRGQSSKYSFIYTEGVLTVLGKDELVMFPIPATELVNIASSDRLIKSVLLYNDVGQQVGIYEMRNYSTQIDVSSLPPGQYIAKTYYHQSNLPPSTTKILVSK